MNFSKKYNIKIPKNIKILYYPKKHILILIGPLCKKILNLKLKIEIIKTKNSILVTFVPCKKILDKRKHTLHALCGTTVSIIRQSILETFFRLHKKIKFIGVGYKVFIKNFKSNKLLDLKLGYSHSIYYKVPKIIQISSLKSTQMFIFGNSYSKITQVAAKIRSYKQPEPYKGKGILYKNEKIKLKKGKKI